MSVGGNPGDVYKVKVTGNSGNVATFSNDEVSISLAGPAEEIAKYQVGDDGTVHFRFGSGPEPDAGSGAASSG